MADPLILDPLPSIVLRLSSHLASPSLRSPEVDEMPRPYELPKDLAERLAHAKATDVAQQHLGAVVIGSDQVGFCAGELLSKPAPRQMLFRLCDKTLERPQFFLQPLSALNNIPVASYELHSISARPSSNSTISPTNRS